MRTADVNASHDPEVVVGIDLGTSGLRTIAVDASGEVRWALDRAVSARRGAGEHEQDPAEWWSTLSNMLQELTRSISTERIAGIAATSTSGTLLAVDQHGDAVRPALLYDDMRGAAVMERLNSLSGETRWNASHSLTKAVWLREYEPGTWKRINRLLHPADWLLGKFCGVFRLSDYSNSLKLGFDAETGSWSDTVAKMGIDAALLPCVKAPGSIVEQTGAAAADAGLPRGIPLIAAGTDGLASLVASGASQAGDGNTTIGTTLVWKVLSQSRVRSDSLYSHRHPGGFWAPGAASNSGASCLEYGERDPETWNRASEEFLPTDVLCYPLRSKGERYPFNSPNWSGFVEPATKDERVLHAARLQGIAFVERWGYEKLQEACVAVGATVYSAGTASSSRVLNKLRASVLGRTILRGRHPSAAFGAAVLAASAVWYDGDIASAIRNMVRPAAVTEPEASFQGRYETLYREFREVCRRRGCDV